MEKLTKEQVIEKYNSGMTIREMKKLYGNDRRQIQNWLKLDGVAIVTGNYKYQNLNEQEVCDLYLSGMTIEGIADNYGRSSRYISKILTKNNVSIRNGSIDIGLTEDEIINLYLNESLSYKRIANIVGCSESYIRKILVKNNIKGRDNSITSRKYSINNNFFDEIDTPEKAYILGLLYADGYNSPTRNTVSISLQERDKHILLAIRDLLYPNKDKPLFFRKPNKNHKGVYTLTLNGKKISDSLYKHGVVYKKAKIIKYPKTLKDNLHSHFIRGYFDGDGSIIINKDYNRPTFSLVSSSKVFLEELQRVLMKECDLEKTKLIKHSTKNSYSLAYSGRIQNSRIFKFIYNNAKEMKLIRKYERYKDAVKRYL